LHRIAAYIPEALDGIWRNRTRSLLSILGMVIGIASVIAVLGLSQAGSNGMKAALAKGGDPGFVALVDQSQNDPTIATMYYRDAALVETYAAGSIARAIPGYAGEGYQIASSGKSSWISLTSTDAIDPNRGIRMLQGRLLDANDVQSAARVGILSESASEKLFPAGNAVGQTLNVGPRRITIVGVFTVTGSLFNSTVGDSLYVPYTTMHLIDPGPIDYLQFWATPGTGSVDAIAAVRAALQKIHPRGQYTISDQAAFIGVFENVLSSVGIGLTVIGGFALLVAGIGIMNIMLVSVTERTREIGIRKSIGASAGDISLQFLIEAIALSLLGGTIGSLLGIGAVAAGRSIIAQAVGAAPVPWLAVIGIAAGFSLMVGVLAGFYPALRASALHPVEALRS
jgi:putative ABC transport system permease protein